MASMQGALTAALDLEQAGADVNEHHEQPSVELALWAAALSGQKHLDWNARQVAILRPFVVRGLPADHETTYTLVANFGHSFVTHREIDACYFIQFLAHDGSLAEFETQPDTLDAWYKWRERLYTLVAGHGLSRKMVSFAGLLLWPRACLLVPVDTWVCRRTGHSVAEYRRLSASKLLYLAIEADVVDEWLLAGEPCPLSVWHWTTWSQARQDADREPAGDTCESHELLSPYWY